MEDTESPTQRLRTLLVDGTRQLREWRFARRVCNEALRAYDSVRERSPALAGAPLYEAVVAQRLRIDAQQASRLVQDAYASREDWEHDRPVCLRDVVLFMIVSEYLREGKGHRGMSLDLGNFLEQRVPAHL
jgi:hypothetical protein